MTGNYSMLHEEMAARFPEVRPSIARFIEDYGGRDLPNYILFKNLFRKYMEIVWDTLQVSPPVSCAVRPAALDGELPPSSSGALVESEAPATSSLPRN